MTLSMILSVCKLLLSFVFLTPTGAQEERILDLCLSVCVSVYFIVFSFVEALKEYKFAGKGVGRVWEGYRKEES